MSIESSTKDTAKEKERHFMGRNCLKQRSLANKRGEATDEADTNLALATSQPCVQEPKIRDALNININNRVSHLYHSSFLESLIEISCNLETTPG